jgi:hypothetical protein
MDLTTLPRPKLFSSAEDSTLSFVYHNNYAEFSGFKIANRVLGCKGKGKAIPLQAWTGSEGSRR